MEVPAEQAIKEVEELLNQFSLNAEPAVRVFCCQQHRLGPQGAKSTQTVFHHAQIRFHFVFLMSILLSARSYSASKYSLRNELLLAMIDLASGCSCTWIWQTGVRALVVHALRHPETSTKTATHGFAYWLSQII